MERLTLDPVEMVVRSDGSEHLEGYAVVFYDGTPKTEYPLGPNKVERVRPSAVDESLWQSKVEARFNHSDDYLLDDTEATLQLTKDGKGLRYSLPYDKSDPQHQTVRSKIMKRQIKGSSFRADALCRWEQEGDKSVRWIEKVENLVELGPCYRPAFKGTSAMIRSADDDGYEKWQETQKRVAKYK
jgi:HK97 family phage prohead protease